jgi:hypothetical protein
LLADGAKRKPANGRELGRLLAKNNRIFAFFANISLLVFTKWFE